MQPNFLIIGPPKCASTSLHHYLGQHPEIYVSEEKETNFFTKDYNKGLEFYEKYFANAGNAKAIGEATPSYSFLPFAADRIQKSYPDIKLILCFRNPVERAFSNWLMLWDAGVEKAGFKDAIQINLKQTAYINFEGENGATVFNSRENNIDAGEKWVRTYLQAGMYAQILINYYKSFPKENIKIIYLEDINKRRDETLKEIFTFLGVDDNFSVPSVEEQNYYYNRKIFRVLNGIIGVKNTRQIAKLLPENIKTIFKQKKGSAQKIPVLPNDDRLFLWNYYKDDIQELEKITRKNFAHWAPKQLAGI